MLYKRKNLQRLLDNEKSADYLIFEGSRIRESKSASESKEKSVDTSEIRGVCGCMEGNDYIFGQYLKNLRKRRNVSTEALAQGCCDGSLIRKIESGKRKASYNLRTLLIERLGQDSSKYENILNLNEYREVCARSQILDAVVNEKIDEAKELLRTYYQEYAVTDKLCLQFYYEIQGRISEDKVDCFSKALQQTCEYTKLSVNSILSAREINLILEWAKALGKSDYRETVAFIFKLIEHMECEPEWIAVIYPKIVLEYISCFSKEKDEMATIQKNILMLEKVLLIQKTHKSLFMLADVLERLLDLLRKLNDMSDENYLFRTKDYEEKLELVKQIENASDLPVWAFLHKTGNVVFAGDIIKQRRKMLNISQKILANGICDYRTISRTEAGKMSLEMYTCSLVFNKLGLPLEFQRTYIVPDDVLVLELEEKIRWLSNEGKYNEALEKLEQMSKRIDMSIAVNKQFYMRNVAIINWKLKKINDIDCEQELEKALKLTVSIEDINYESIYLTSQEWICVYNILLVNPKNETCSSILYAIKKDNNRLLIPQNVNSLLLMALAQKYNKLGYKEYAVNIVDHIMKNEIKKANSALIATLLLFKAYYSSDADMKSTAEKLSNVL